MTVPVTALGMASFRHLEIDSALRATFDWWSEAELRDIEPGEDLEKFISMFWTTMQAWYLDDRNEAEEASQ